MNETLDVGRGPNEVLFDVHDTIAIGEIPSGIYDFILTIMTSGELSHAIVALELTFKGTSHDGGSFSKVPQGLLSS
jgi:hypothetical protein